MKKLFFLLCLAGGVSTAGAQVETPQPSPFTKIEQKVGLTDISLEYSRPAVRGRKLFGGLVPLGQVWRTGANQNTRITFSDDVVIGGQQLERGTYALYTIPQEQEWEVIFYEDAENWGNPQTWEETKIVLKTAVPVRESPVAVENFTIFFNDLKYDSATMDMLWGTTQVSLDIEVPTETKTMASIEKSLGGDPGPNDYFAAASYYHDQGKDLEKAYEWINKTISMGNGAFYVLRKKSLIEYDLGKKEEAIATARESLAKAEEAGNQDYVKMNRVSLEEWEAQ